jgi:hypothetical protein
LHVCEGFSQTFIKGSPLLPRNAKCGWVDL